MMVMARGRERRRMCSETNVAKGNLACAWDEAAEVRACGLAIQRAVSTDEQQRVEEKV